jgi:hypothetical protein
MAAIIPVPERKHPRDFSAHMARRRYFAGGS